MPHFMDMCIRFDKFDYASDVTTKENFMAIKLKWGVDVNIRVVHWRCISQSTEAEGAYGVRYGGGIQGGARNFFYYLISKSA